MQPSPCFAVALKETVDLGQFSLIKIGNKSTFNKYVDAALIYK